MSRGDFGAYVRGVGRMVFYEAARTPATVITADEPLAPDATSESSALGCLDECLDNLAVGERRLILRYYDTGDQIVHRRELARELALSPTALRIKAHRLRVRLESCVSSCVQRT